MFISNLHIFENTIKPPMLHRHASNFAHQQQGQAWLLVTTFQACRCNIIGFMRVRNNLKCEPTQGDFLIVLIKQDPLFTAQFYGHFQGNGFTAYLIFLVQLLARSIPEYSRQTDVRSNKFVRTDQTICIYLKYRGMDLNRFTHDPHRNFVIKIYVN